MSYEQMDLAGYTGLLIGYSSSCVLQIYNVSVTASVVFDSCYMCGVIGCLHQMNFSISNLSISDSSLQFLGQN